MVAAARFLDIVLEVQQKKGSPCSWSYGIYRANYSLSAIEVGVAETATKTASKKTGPWSQTDGRIGLAIHKEAAVLAIRAVAFVIY